MTVNLIQKIGKSADMNNYNNSLDLSFKEFNQLREILEEHIKRKNACKTMASNIHTQVLIDFWKDEIAQDVLLLQKLNKALSNYNHKD